MRRCQRDEAESWTANSNKKEREVEDEDEVEVEEEKMKPFTSRLQVYLSIYLRCGSFGDAEDTTFALRFLSMQQQSLFSVLIKLFDGEIADGESDDVFFYPPSCHYPPFHRTGGTLARIVYHDITIRNMLCRDEGCLVPPRTQSGSWHWLVELVQTGSVSLLCTVRSMKVMDILFMISRCHFSRSDTRQAG